MHDVQELLTRLHRDNDPETAEAQLLAIIDAVKELDTLLVAWYTPTRHYFMTKEFGQPTAVIFSNRDSFERFAERSQEQGYEVSAIENPSNERMLLFADLWRCGFTRVMIDYAPEFVNLHIGDFYPIPDQSDMPLNKRSVICPALTGKILYLFQQIYARKADGNTELDALRELYHSPLILPADVFYSGGSASTHVPSYQRDGKRCVRLFTDYREMARADLPDDLTPTVARIGDLQQLMKKGVQIISINEGSGAELALDAELLDVAEKAAMGELEGITIQSMQEHGEKVTVTDAKDASAELLQAMQAVFQNHSEVVQAYLRVIKMENTLRPHYLVIIERTEDRGEKALYRELAEAAMPYLGTYDLECVNRDKAESWIKDTKPFYRKKRFSLFR